MDKTKEEKTNKAIGDAYDYVIGVIERQERVLSVEEMYYGYSSMGFRPEFKKEPFKKVYSSILEYMLDKGFIKRKEPPPSPCLVCGAYGEHDEGCMIEQGGNKHG